MKTHDHGFDEKSKGKIKRKRGNSNRDKVFRYVASLNQEQISRMMENSTSLFAQPHVDQTGRSIMHNSMNQQQMTVQAKLEISQPGDSSEMQADKVADAVSRGDVSMSRMTMTQTGSEINAKGEGGTLTTTPEFNQQLEGTKGSGNKLDEGTKSEMEHHMGTDLSDVKIHTGTTASNMSEDINAKAFTHGQDIYFKDGNYNPNSGDGKNLLAHELMHTVQQGSGKIQPKIQGSMKFEIQTPNHVIAIKNQGKNESLKKYNPDPQLLPRKYAPTTIGYEGDVGEERGELPAYLSVGKRGVAKDGTYFEEYEGDQTMVEDKKADKTKWAQFWKIYAFTSMKIKDVIGKTVDQVGTLESRGEIDQSFRKHNPNTFYFIYYDANGKRMSVHLDEDGKFQNGEIEFMKVGRKKKPGFDKKKSAQYIETWKLSLDPYGNVFLGNLRIRAEQIEATIDNSIKGIPYNANTYDKKYYNASDFSGNKLNKGAKHLDIHIDKDGQIRSGHIKFMEKKHWDKEQTAVEIQAEHGGFIEFETSKWFKEWSALKLRIQDAVNFTKTVNNNSWVLSEMYPTDKKIMDGAKIEVDAMRKKLGLEALDYNKVRFVEWPEKEYSTSHLTNLKKDNRRLIILIVDPTWYSRIQGSEGIKLSQYESLMREHERDTVIDTVLPAADNIFTKAFNAAKVNNPKLNVAKYAELKGFVQLITNYIYKGQRFKSNNAIAKSAFRLMSRTDFASMYKELLSHEEQDLFKTMIGNPKKANDNPILSEIEAALYSSSPLTRKSTFFTIRVGTNPATATFGPIIYNWLVGITNGQDLLKEGGVSAAIGAKTVETTPGDKDYKLAQFEVRGSVAFGGNDQPVSNWVEYARQVFSTAAARKRTDIPDDPTTANVNESTKTQLKI